MVEGHESDTAWLVRSDEDVRVALGGFRDYDVAREVEDLAPRHVRVGPRYRLAHLPRARLEVAHLGGCNAELVGVLPADGLIRVARPTGSRCPQHETLEAVDRSSEPSPITQRPGSVSSIGSSIDSGPIPPPSKPASSTPSNTSLWVTSRSEGLISRRPSTSTDPFVTRRMESLAGSNSHLEPGGCGAHPPRRRRRRSRAGCA
jgi:hypothetical protein